MAKFVMTMLVCRDVTKSRDFYRDVMGLPVGTDAAPHWVDFNLGGDIQLGLHPTTDDMQVLPGSQSIGFSVDAVDDFVASVKARGVTIVSEPSDQRFGRLAVLADPDGYEVQVYTPIGA